MAGGEWLLGYSHQYVLVDYSSLSSSPHPETQTQIIRDYDYVVICFIFQLPRWQSMNNANSETSSPSSSSFVSLVYFYFFWTWNCCLWDSPLHLRVRLHRFLQHLLTAPSYVSFNRGRRRRCVSTRLGLRCGVWKPRRSEPVILSTMERLGLGSPHLPWKSPHSIEALSAMLLTFPFGKRLVLSSDSVMVSVSEFYFYLIYVIIITSH